MKNKILLVDDEKDIVALLQYNLEREGFEVFSAYNGEDAIRALIKKPDLVILDVMMPKMDGFEVCRKIRQMNGLEQIPVIFLTAKTTETDEIYGLEIGADDFIRKPVSPKKLVARIKSNLRRSDGTTDGKPFASKIKSGPLLIDREKHSVKLNKEEIILPRKEFDILYYLASHPGKVFGREVILRDVWGTDIFVVERTVDVHIRKIREKLGQYAEIIETIKGVGYRFKSPE